MFDNKNVLVTGGNGMIGRQLVELLYDTTSANVTVADLPNVDLRDRKDCKAVCEGQDIVFHLAGIKVHHKDVWKPQHHLVYR